jgi:hypothetical protein
VVARDVRAHLDVRVAGDDGMLLGSVAAAGEARIVALRIISKTGLPIANRVPAFRRGRLR